MPSTDLLGALVNGGLGALIGAVSVAAINVLGKKGESRATAADLLTNAGVGLVDRLTKDNVALRRDNQHMREAIITLTDVVDELIPACDLPDDVKARLRDANHKAKMTV